jgi:hypothetical protein
MSRQLLQFITVILSSITVETAIIELSPLRDTLTTSPWVGTRHRPILRHITTHERALLEFVTRELESRPAESLEPVMRLLRDRDVR